VKVDWPLKNNVARLDGLNSNTDYQVRLNIYEKNVRFHSTAGKAHPLKTKGNCSKSCESSFILALKNKYYVHAQNQINILSKFHQLCQQRP
jgi:hypothetical protein